LGRLLRPGFKGFTLAQPGDVSGCETVVFQLNVVIAAEYLRNPESHLLLARFDYALEQAHEPGFERCAGLAAK